MTPPTERGTCRVCRRSVRLDVDGRVSAHPSPAGAGDDLDDALPGNCGGVGYLPATAPAQ